WVRDVVLADGKVSPKDVDLLHVTDDLDEAVSIMVGARKERAESGPGGGEPPVEPHRSE
ncbi:MAG: hypothetical protein H0U28_13530, partial [Nocardioidaceae bacterium]|nr:hypothetical protein [Nocardioidaceae bacterium]